MVRKEDLMLLGAAIVIGLALIAYDAAHNACLVQTPEMPTLRQVMGWNQGSPTLIEEE